MRPRRELWPTCKLALRASRLVLVLVERDRVAGTLTRSSANHLKSEFVVESSVAWFQPHQTRWRCYQLEKTPHSPHRTGGRAVEGGELRLPQGRIVWVKDGQSSA